MLNVLLLQVHNAGQAPGTPGVWAAAADESEIRSALLFHLHQVTSVAQKLLGLGESTSGRRSPRQALEIVMVPIAASRCALLPCAQPARRCWLAARGW
jgi:hypothetical protein